MPRALARVLEKAQAVCDTSGGDWKVKHGVGHAQSVICPAHDDHNPSLSVDWSSERKAVLLNCHAGCEAGEVLSALGLTWADLKAQASGATVEAEYDYFDLDGTLQFQVVRYEGKSFRQRRPDPDVPGGWRYSVKDLPAFRSLPYRMSELVEALSGGEDVYVVEGEKDVDALDMGARAVATCNAGGAGKWTDAHSEHFRGSTSRIVVVADRDRSGWLHAEKVAASLARVAGVRAEIVASTVGKDAADHIGDHGLDEFETVTADDFPKPTRTLVSESETAPQPRRVVVRPASEYVSRRQRFLWEGRVPLGTLTLFTGDGGVGKSTFALWLAAQAQTGNLPGDFHGEPISVIYVSVEDDWATQVKPRLQAVGANLVTLYNVQVRGAEGDDGERYPNLPDDLAAVRDALEQTGARLVILDPITSTMHGDDHKRGDVRAVLDPLAALAAEVDCAVIGIMHFNKGGGNARDKLSGSHAFRDTARSVLHFAEDKDRPGITVLSQDKGNYSQNRGESLEYQLLDTEVPLDDGEVGHHPRVEMLGISMTDVQSLINRQPIGSEAVEWLREYMADHPHGVLAKDALAAAEANGHSADALKRARPRLGIASEKVPGDMGNGWRWIKKATSLEHPPPSPSSSVPGQTSALFGASVPASAPPSSTVKRALDGSKRAGEIPPTSEEGEEGDHPRARDRLKPKASRVRRPKTTEVENNHG